MAMHSASRPTILALLASLLVAWCTELSAAPPGRVPPDAALDGMRKEALKAARNGRPDLRKEILGKLAGHASEEAIDLVVRLGFSSKDAGVRAAARETLAARRDDDAFAALLVERTGSELAAGKIDTAVDLAAVLLAGEAAEAPGPTRIWLDGPAAVTGEADALCWAVATAAAARGGAEEVAVLRALSRLRRFNEDFPFRRGVVRALVAVNRLEAIDALIDILEDLRGEARADVVSYLAFVSGTNHGTDAVGWRRWFAEQRDQVVIPPSRPDYPPPQARLVSADNQADPAYYGIPLYAEKAVFLIDVSSSMEERGRLETAKRELESAIFILPADAAFTVIAYSDRAVAWENALVPADDDAKRSAAAFVRGLRPDGRTATGDALALAFSLDIEAVYLLSDGRPTAGRVVEPARIVRMVAEANQSRRVSLHTIGIAPDAGLAEFLAVLARSNYGLYRHVED